MPGLSRARFVEAFDRLISGSLSARPVIDLDRRICRARCGSTVVVLASVGGGVRADVPYQTLGFRCPRCQARRFVLETTYTAGDYAIEGHQVSLRDEATLQRMPDGVRHVLYGWVRSQYYPRPAPTALERVRDGFIPEDD
jgi:DNA-directed RNA polymerase subunit RPC12/RpoP